MDNKRRAKIRKAIKMLQTTQPNFDDARELLEDVLSDEEMARDNMEEFFSETDRYQVMCDNCDYLDEAISEIDEDDSDCVDAVVAALTQIDGI